MPGDQVGGVFGDQPVQPPSLAGFALVKALYRRVATAGQHLLAMLKRDEGPQQDALAHPRFDLDNRSALLQASVHQCHMVGRQQAGDARPRPALEQRLHCRVGRHDLGRGVEQHGRLRVVDQQR